LLGGHSPISLNAALISDVELGHISARQVRQPRRDPRRHQQQVGRRFVRE
jgi:hypothetical protein